MTDKTTTEGPEVKRFIWNGRKRAVVLATDLGDALAHERRNTASAQEALRDTKLELEQAESALAEWKERSERVEQQLANAAVDISRLEERAEDAEHGLAGIEALHRKALEGWRRALAERTEAEQKAFDQHVMVGEAHTEIEELRAELKDQESRAGQAERLQRIAERRREVAVAARKNLQARVSGVEAQFQLREALALLRDVQGEEPTDAPCKPDAPSVADQFPARFERCNGTKELVRDQGNVPCPGCPDCQPPTEAGEKALRECDVCLEERPGCEWVNGEEGVVACASCRPGWLGRSLDQAHENIMARPEYLRPARYRSTQPVSPEPTPEAGRNDASQSVNPPKNAPNGAESDQITASQRPELTPVEEMLTMIALGLKNISLPGLDLDGADPERGVELLIEWAYAHRPIPAQDCDPDCTSFFDGVPDCPACNDRRWTCDGGPPIPCPDCTQAKTMHGDANADSVHIEGVDWPESIWLQAGRVRLSRFWRKEPRLEPGFKCHRYVRVTADKLPIAPHSYEEVVEVLAERLHSEVWPDVEWEWELKDAYREEARYRLSAITPLLQGLGEGGRERLRLIATRIGEEFDAEFPPHEKAAGDVAFLRDLADRTQPVSDLADHPSGPEVVEIEFSDQSEVEEIEAAGARDGLEQLLGWVEEQRNREARVYEDAVQRKEPRAEVYFAAKCAYAAVANEIKRRREMEAGK